MDEIICDGYKLPMPLPNEKIIEIFKRMNEGDEHAKSIIVEHNLRLVLSIVNDFHNVSLEKSELFSIGCVGLMHAINTFEISKNNNFSTLASKCIKHEILKTLKFNKSKCRNIKAYSLEEIIFTSEDGDNLTLEDSIEDKVDILTEYTDKETYKMVHKLVEELPSSRDKNILTMYFWENLSQHEIAKKYSLSKNAISLIILRNLRYIGRELKKMKLIETDDIHPSLSFNKGPRKKNNI